MSVECWIVWHTSVGCDLTEIVSIHRTHRGALEAAVQFTEHNWPNRWKRDEGEGNCWSGFAAAEGESVRVEQRELLD
mgnify:CR=1 FL=1